jgi:adenylate cyclase
MACCHSNGCCSARHCVIAWWIWSATKPATSPAVVTATSVAQPLVAPRMSIVVLPFANLSDDRDQQYFADGIT